MSTNLHFSDSFKINKLELNYINFYAAFN